MVSVVVLGLSFVAICVLSFAFLWSPFVFSVSGRSTFRYDLTPSCRLILPSELVELDGVSEDFFRLGYDVDDLTGVTSKPLPMIKDSFTCLNTNVLKSRWDRNQSRCLFDLTGPHLDSYSEYGWGCEKSATNSILSCNVSLNIESGFSNEHNCIIASDRKTHTKWINDAVCSLGGKNTVTVLHINTSDPFLAHRECLERGGKYSRGELPVVWPSLRLDYTLNAYGHVILGNLYFLLGLINFSMTGLRSKHLHKALGLIYSFLCLVTWSITWGVIFAASLNNMTKLLINCTGNLLWLYTLIRSLHAIRVNTDVRSHRRWMIRNYAVAFSIIMGRYAGIPFIFIHRTFSVMWTNASTFETDAILFSWIITLGVVEFFLEYEDKISNNNLTITKDKIN